MPIFDQGYQHWNGKVNGLAWRWLAVTRQGLRQQTRRRRTRMITLAAFLPALVLSAFLIFWGLFEQKSSFIQPLLFLVQGLPEELRDGPKGFRTVVWTFAFDQFFATETFFAMLLVLAVGPDLVSQDLRFNAFPLYLSRPLRRVDYFLGKLGVIAVVLGVVAIGPALLAYALGLAFSFDPTVLRDTWRILAGSVAYGCVVVISAGTLMLALSSLSRNSLLVGATFIGVWVVSSVTSTVLQGTLQKDWCPLVSYTGNLDRVRAELLDSESARKKFVELFIAGRETGERLARPRVLFGRRPPRPPRPPGQPRNSQGPGMVKFDPANPTDLNAALETLPGLRHPWTWSAGVLGVLFLASALTLSTRVKSLDRLK